MSALFRSKEGHISSTGYLHPRQRSELPKKAEEKKKSLHLLEVRDPFPDIHRDVSANPGPGLYNAIYIIVCMVKQQLIKTTPVGWGGGGNNLFVFSFI